MEEKVKEIISSFFELSDRKDCFLVELIVRPNKRLEVYVDSDQGIDFEICTRLSRKIEEYLDESKDLGEDYTLEVSSHGLDRPLMLPRQFVKNIGREVTVKTPDKQKIIGTLVQAEDATFTIERQKPKVPGEKKKKEMEQLSFEYLDHKVLINIKF